MSASLRAFECAGSDGVQDQQLVVFPGAASETDEAGKILLHYAAEKQASDSIVKSIQGFSFRDQRKTDRQTIYRSSRSTAIRQLLFVICPRDGQGSDQ